MNDDLLPQMDEAKGKVVYLVDYFGIMDKAVQKYVAANPETIFLIDNAHSFYNKPIMRNNVYNLYSCKKFFGVPDGGYLISERKIDQVYEKTNSSQISNYLIKSLEGGTNSCYQEKKAVDEYINNNYSGISILAEKLLSCIDYKKIKKIRKRNFNIYQQYFAEKNQIKCEKESIPYIYPLKARKDIKEKLIKEKIYVPTLWSQVLDARFDNTLEKKMAENTLFLPLDQRYDERDIKYISERVQELL
jgi:dTDP-4-amino-4,6-dideoxygalactose transaminase